jgi:hypothetical protein
VSRDHPLAAAPCATSSGENACTWIPGAASRAVCSNLQLREPAQQLMQIGWPVCDMLLAQMQLRFHVSALASSTVVCFQQAWASSRQCAMTV